MNAAAEPGGPTGCRLAVAGALLVAVLAATLAGGVAHAAPAARTSPTATASPRPTAGPWLAQTSAAGPSAAAAAGSAAPGPSAGPAGIRLGPDSPALPTATPAGGPQVGAGTSTETGLFDISGHIRDAINGWFRDLVTSALDPVLTLLGSTVLSTPDVTGGRVHELWLVCAGIANTTFVLFVLAGGAIVMSHETLQTRYAAKQIAPRLVVGIIAANLSLAVVGLAVGFANALSGALLGQGVDAGSATGVLRTLVLAPLAGGGSFLVLIGLVVAVLALLLVGTYLIRVAVLVVLVVAGPLVLACHALPYTEGAAQLWWRALAGALATQVGQSLVLVTAVRVFFAAGGSTGLGLSASGALVNVLLACALLYVLVKIPSWVARMVFGGRRGTSTAQMVKTALIYRTVRAGVAVL
jgi:hypothetical protein